MLNLSLEIIAVITAILYLVLAAKEDVKCWYAAIISSSLYFYIMLNAGLLMEAILQVFYVGMAIYGWKQWNKLSNEQYEIRIKKWKKINHLYAVGIVVILAIISKDILEKYTNAVFPFCILLDAIDNASSQLVGIKLPSIFFNGVSSRWTLIPSQTNLLLSDIHSSLTR